MTSNQYDNYQTPSSRPPEPPTRSSTSADMQYQTTAASGHDPFAAGSTDRFEYATQPASAAGSEDKQEKKAEKKSGGAAKPFVFGFLGALLACGLSFGGFFAWYTGQADNQGGSATQATTILGTTDTSVINAVEEGQTLAEAVAAKALPSVVAVYNYQEASSYYGYGQGSGELSLAGMGSGVLISEDGYILTNYHVIEDAGKLTVKVGDEERDATLVGGDDSSDVAVVKIDNIDGMVVADIGDSDDLAIGEWVMTIGAPLGLEQSVATGVVSATNRSTIMSDSPSYGYGYYSGTPEYTYYPNMIQTDAVINPGNSGGALVDADGKLIGINTMISSYSGDYAGVGFAIPVNYAIGIAEDIIAGKEPTHAALGVTISQVNASVAQRYDLSTDSGAYISGLVEGSGAAESGMEIGDIITAVNGKAVASVTDVTLDVREHAPGDTVTVTVNRNGEELNFDVVLMSDKDMSTASTNEQGSYGNDLGTGNGGNGGGGAYGYTEEELELLMQLLGM